MLARIRISSLGPARVSLRPARVSVVWPPLANGPWNCGLPGIYESQPRTIDGIPRKRPLGKSLPDERTEPRVTTMNSGTFIGQAIYAPCVGAWHAHHHKAFLAAVLDNHVHHHQRKRLPTWSAGDFNIRGVAQGDSAEPSRSAAGLTRWFKMELAKRSLQACPSPATHRRGTQMGGALDIHIIETSPNIKPTVVW